MSIQIEDLEVMETKQYKKLAKESGKEYAKEFISKTDDELKSAIMRYMVEKNKVEEEMNANPEYSLAKTSVKKRKDILKDDLKGPKALADLALEVLERASENHTPDDTIVDDTKQYKAVSRVFDSNKSNELTKMSEESLNDLVLEYHTTKKHKEHQMSQEENYQKNSEIVKVFEKATKDAVKPQKACADMAVELLKRRKGA